MYWEVADLHALGAEEALARIEAAVQALVAACHATPATDR
jgi:hypothetical protein